MTQRPDPEAVLGDFGDLSVSYQGRSALVFEREGRFFMELPDGSGGRRRAEVALCVGSRRYQQYFEAQPRPDGAVAYLRLPLLWHIEQQRWMHMNTVFLHPDNPDWDAHRSAWNGNCIFCHNTAPRPGVRGLPPGGGPDDAFFDSSAADLGIACESCHGPGQDHARRMRGPIERYAAVLSDEPMDDVIHPERLGQMESIALCAQCHGQRMPKSMDLIETWMTSGPTFRPGDILADHVDLVRRETPSPDPTRPDLLRDRFWGDGTPRLTAYEAQGLLDSPCLAGGEITCLTCHEMHGGDPRGMVEPRMRTNEACTRCHEDIGLGVAAHSGHAADGPGSACLDCHMPRVVYGIVDLHRSHRIENPDPRRDAEAGRPNACTLCHLDRSPVWAAREMSRIFGREFPAPRTRPGGAPVDLADGVALLTAGDAVERAAVAAAMGRAPQSAAIERGDRAFLVALLVATLGDGYPSIRRLARRALLELEEDDPLGLAPRLQSWDPMDTAGREALIAELLTRLASAAPGRLAPPEPGLLLRSDFTLDDTGLGALLELQSTRTIAIGE
jgi:predicted CXXCH cytochrome family protein